MQKEAGIVNGDKGVQTTTRQLREGTMEVCNLACICDTNSMRQCCFWLDAKRQQLLLLPTALPLSLPWSLYVGYEGHVLMWV